MVLATGATDGLGRALAERLALDGRYDTAARAELWRRSPELVGYSA